MPPRPCTLPGKFARVLRDVTFERHFLHDKGCAGSNVSHEVHDSERALAEHLHLLVVAALAICHRGRHDRRHDVSTTGQRVTTLDTLVVAPRPSGWSSENEPTEGSTEHVIFLVKEVATGYVSIVVIK